ncbi:MAG: hypothetical protein NZ516_02725 [Raineya sp.]|nr:hypothetical protein [Raineya sp.]
MKKVFLSFFGISLLMMMQSFQMKENLFKKKIDITLVSQEGCTIHIVGVVTFELFPPKITDFDGTVTISGPGNCPNGTLTLGDGKRSTATIIFVPDSYTLGEITDVTWRGSNPVFISVLNQDHIKRTFIEALNEM